MDLEDWKRIKRNGGYRRKVKNRYENMRTAPNLRVSNFIQPLPDSASTTEVNKKSMGSVELLSVDIIEGENVTMTNYQDDNYDDNSDSECSGEYNNCLKTDEFRRNIASWAIEFNITHRALNKLSKTVNTFIPHSLPLDARTFLNTNHLEININEMSGGKYWHNGLIEQLRKYLQRCSEVPKTVSLNVNIDGLPIYKSSNYQFWPILCNIAELQEIAPIVIGIYVGTSKPSDLNAYLQSFITEVKQLENGLIIVDKTGSEKNVTVKIRAFICDSPARALIKGIMNFNGKHGCSKCTVIGEYSHISHTVTFQSINCDKRNNEDFRRKGYGLHHKNDSPLLELKIDMIEDFPACDSLHLIDLGIMKRLLIGWRDGNLGKYITKWSSRDIEGVNRFLANCSLPKEIHRSVRQLNVLAHWKASEYRTFLYYLSPLLLNNFLNSEAYHHFLCFFCAITICSNEKHFKFLRLADELLKFFITHYDDFYSKHYITSNVHNLCHIVDEVRKFGKLHDFNAYPFENKLFMIKRLLRHGNKPLEQAARRLMERNFVELDSFKENILSYPFVKETRSKSGKLNILYLEKFMLSTHELDKWFLTRENQVVEIKLILSHVTSNEILLQGDRIENLSDAFERPIRSSLLNIYNCDLKNIKKTVNIEFTVSNIQCKLVCVKYDTTLFFIPLLHTL